MAGAVLAVLGVSDPAELATNSAESASTLALDLGARRALERAGLECARRKDEAIETIHLLLALLDCKDVIDLLEEEYGIEVKELRSAVNFLLGGPPAMESR